MSSAAVRPAPSPPRSSGLTPFEVEVSHVKRAIELVRADPAFRAAFERTPAEAIAPYRLQIEEGELKRLAAYLATPAGERDPDRLGERARRYLDTSSECRELREAGRTRSEPQNGMYRRWRARQIARTRSEQGAQLASYIVFLTGAFELSRGCSVGCWFCGVSAPKLSDLYRYTPENAALFRECLEVMVALCGRASVATNLTYWATDPLDNPDYERFADVFEEVAGAYPLVTTALALRDPERTRRLLQRASGRAVVSARFSVLSLGLLRRIFEAFRPEEMRTVDCVFLNPESTVVKANAGRFRERAEEDPEILAREASKRARTPDDVVSGNVPGTIACVAGFLFNMVDRRVQLVSPCRADARWPLGYRIHDIASFHDGGDVGGALDRAIERHMPEAPPAARPVAFRRDLTLDPAPNGFHLVSRHRRLRVESGPQAALLQQLGRRIGEGASTPLPLADALARELDVAPRDVQDVLALLFDRGALDDEPVPLSTAAPSATTGARA
jgi:radical SAM family RiPP maturation amino acid epimerase